MAKKKYKSDFMSNKMDSELEQMEKSLSALYSNALKEVESEFAKFTDTFKSQDARKRQELESGNITDADYSLWRQKQILHTDTYKATINKITDTLVKSDKAAMAVINGKLPSVVAQSYNFTQALGWASAKKSGLSMGTFQVYNARSVQAIMQGKKIMKDVDVPADTKWNRDKINKAISTSIIKGDSIEKTAESLQHVTNMDNNAAIRNARTCMTAAENLGRTEAADDLKAKGIPLDEVWSCVHDSRTRETHIMLDGTKRDETTGKFGEGILDNPLEYPASPDGDAEEIYNCRCRISIELEGIDHSNDDELYKQFMKENDADSYEAMKEKDDDKEAAFQAHKDAAEAKYADKQAESNTQDLPPITDLTPADDSSSGKTGVVDGDDLSYTWERRPDEFDYEINDAINAQGFDGLPRVVSEEEFNKAVEESGFIAQRTYSANDQETLDAYRDQLYHGDWYVDCSAGGAQYGQGMYCAADYTGNLSDGIQQEMEHYKALNESKGNEYNNTETLTLAPNAKILTLPKGEDAYEYISSEFDNHAIRASIKDTGKAEETERILSLRKQKNENYQAYLHGKLPMETLYAKSDEMNKEIKSITDKNPDIAKAIDKIQRKSARMNAGSMAALMGYDAINAEGHGASGSYTVILNRTKVIFKEDKKRK